MSFPDFLPGMLVDTASAQIISNSAQTVAGPLLPNLAGGTGVGAFNNLATFLMMRAWLLAAIAATYQIVRAGIRLINGQEEDKLSKARRTIAASLVAVMALYLTPRIVAAIFSAAPCSPNTAGPCGVTATPAGVEAGTSIFAAELYGLIRWVEVLVAPIAIGVIIVSAFRVIATFGKEEGPATMRKAVFSVAAGVILLLLDGAIKLTLGIPLMPSFAAPFAQPSSGPIIARSLQIVSTLLLMLSLIAVAVIVYLGIRLVVSMGNEEEQTKTKSLLLRVFLGFIVIALSYALSVAVVNLVQ